MNKRPNSEGDDEASSEAKRPHLDIGETENEANNIQDGRVLEYVNETEEGNLEDEIETKDGIIEGNLIEGNGVVAIHPASPEEQRNHGDIDDGIKKEDLDSSVELLGNTASVEPKSPENNSNVKEEPELMLEPEVQLNEESQEETQRPPVKPKSSLFSILKIRSEFTCAADNVMNRKSSPLKKEPEVVEINDDGKKS